MYERKNDPWELKTRGLITRRVGLDLLTAVGFTGYRKGKNKSSLF